MAVRDIRHERPRARALLAARHAERLYPGPLGRLVAQELRIYAEGVPRASSRVTCSRVARTFFSSHVT